MPPTLLVTPPLPDPAGATVKAYMFSVNVAVADCAALIVTVHVAAVPLQPPPLQTANVEPLLGVSVNVTNVPAAKLFEQVPPQLNPPGESATLPLPPPVTDVVSA
jgi:hypothetical protein